VARKQGNGDGTIRRREDGRWEARIILSNGQRKSLYAKTRQEASRLMAEARQAREQGNEELSTRQTVEQYLLYWLETIKQHRIEPSTYVRCRYDVRRHLIPRLGRHQLTKLAAQHLQSFYAQELADGYAPGTVRNMHKTLHSALESAVKLGFVHRNVADMAEPPRGGSQEIVVLTEDQARTLLQTVRGDRLEALIVVALATGMRKGELQALRWQDIDLNAGIAQVTRTLKITPEGRRFGRAKTRYSRRTIALPAVAKEALEAHLMRQHEERSLLGDSWQDHDLVFCNENGERLPTSRLDAVGWYGRLLKRAGLPSIRFHDLRHTAATLLLARGVNVKVVSELLGHSSVAVTLSLYGHVLPHMQREAAVAMDQALRGALLP
jgi:integrase